MDAVGSGRNRRKIDHSKHNLMALCREHHTESHNRGQHTFMQLHHVVGVIMSEDQYKKLEYRGVN